MKKTRIAFGLTLAFVATFQAFADAGHAQHNLGQAVKSGESSKISRVIKVETFDSMKFNPEKIKIKLGETIEFSVINKGQLAHEFVIGNMAELKKHAQMMKDMPNMKHDEKNAVTVEAGQTKTLVWSFNKKGKVDFACLLPGHSEAGMVGTIIVN